MSSWAKDGVRERSIRRSERERSKEWADGRRTHWPAGNHRMLSRKRPRACVCHVERWYLSGVVPA